MPQQRSTESCECPLRWLWQLGKASQGKWCSSWVLMNKKRKLDKEGRKEHSRQRKQHVQRSCGWWEHVESRSYKTVWFEWHEKVSRSWREEKRTEARPHIVSDPCRALPHFSQGCSGQCPTSSHQRCADLIQSVPGASLALGETTGSHTGPHRSARELSSPGQLSNIGRWKSMGECFSPLSLGDDSEMHYSQPLRSSPGGWPQLFTVVVKSLISFPPSPIHSLSLTYVSCSLGSLCKWNYVQASFCVLLF